MRTVWTSLLVISFLILTFSGAIAQSGGQLPGRNVNMVSGKGWPGGDPFLQRQNEPSMAVSTRNAMTILAGANDYRTVDIPFVNGSDENGDAWLGVFKSFDAGARWQSILLAGYPQDVSPEGLSSPLHGFQAAADPTVRAGTNGLFYYSGIVFNRGPQGQVPSAVFVARFIDNNNKENGDVTKQAQGATLSTTLSTVQSAIPSAPVATPADRIRYIDAQLVERSKSAQFVDKPVLAVDIPRDNSKCNIVTIQDGKRLKQTLPSGQVYVAFTVFMDNIPNVKRSRIMFARSSTCGGSFTHPFDISKDRNSQEGDDDDNEWDGPGQNTLTLNQSPAIAIDPATGTIYVAFRRFNQNGFSDAIMIAKSTDGGKHFSKAIAAPAFTSSSDGPFDEPTVANSSSPFEGFRFNSYPTLTVDSFGRIYLAWSSRGFGPNPKQDAHILLTTSTDGVNWTSPSEVDPPGAVPNPNENPSPQRGHQLMPSLTFAAGRVMLLHYDLRLDSTFDTLQCVPGPCKNIVDFSSVRQPAGYLDPLDPANSKGIFFPEGVFESFIIDAGIDALNPPLFKSIRRHTLDVRATQIDPMTLQASSVRVSQYNMGSRDGKTLIEQLQFNSGNLPMFITGTAPFMGDFIDIAPSPAFVFLNGRWVYNTSPSNGQDYHAVWTDNRDVHKPSDGNWAHYTPPVTLDKNGNVVPHTTSIFDGQSTVPLCDPSNSGNSGSRNQNIYTALITPGVFINSPANTKPLGTITFNGKKVALQRAFVVNVQNATKGPEPKTFHLRILNQPAGNGGTASFLQFSPLIDLDVNVAPLSSVSRSVFVTSPLNPSASVSVLITETTAGANFQGTIVLNPDPTTPDLLNPDVANPDVANPDVANAEVYNPDVANPDVANPDVANPDVANPDVANPDVANPDVANPDVANPDVANPDVANPDVANPDVANPDVANPDVANPDVANSDLGDGLSDANWTVTNNGNTTAGYAVKLASNAPISGKFQLILRKVYTTPTAQNCQLKLTPHNVVVANIRTRDFKFLSPTDPLADNTTPPSPDVNNTTLSLAPGESAKITLRGNVPLQVMRQIVTTNITPVVVPQAVNTTTVLQGGTSPALNIVTTVLPDVSPFNEGGYTATLLAIGGTRPYRWSIDPLTPLPPGFSLTQDETGATARISGPSSLPDPGRFIIDVQITDASAPTQVDTRVFSLHTPLAITTAALPPVFVGSPYSQQLMATGGVAPIRWSTQQVLLFDVVNSGLPPGLTLDPATGMISGTPTAAGTFTFVVSATDASNLGQVATRTFQIVASTLLIDIPGVSGGDLISRGFYIRAYPGSDLQQATLHFSSNTAGSYLFSLTAHSGAYDGPVIGTSQATAVLSASSTTNVATAFNFGTVPVIPGSLVAFVIQLINGPDPNPFFATSACGFDPACVVPGPAVIETEDVTAPFSLFRRNGVGLRVVGTPAPPTLAGQAIALNGNTDGSGSYMQVPDSNAFDMVQPFTLEAWVNWRGDPGYRVFLSKPRLDTPPIGGLPGDVGTGYAMVIQDGSACFAMIAPGANRLACSSTQLTKGLWTHVAATYDGQTTTIYLNGTQSNSVNFGSVAFPSTDAQGETSTSLLIGREFLYGLMDRTFPGKVDEVRIWNTQLSANTIQSWYNRAVSANHPNIGSLVSYYQFDDGTPENPAIADRSGNGHDGTRFNGAVLVRSDVPLVP